MADIGGNAEQVAEIDEVLAQIRARLGDADRVALDDACRADSGTFATPRDLARRHRLRQVGWLLGGLVVAGALAVGVPAYFGVWWSTPCEDFGIYTIGADGSGRHRVRPHKSLGGLFDV